MVTWHCSLSPPVAAASSAVLPCPAELPPAKWAPSHCTTICVISFPSLVRHFPSELLCVKSLGCCCTAEQNQSSRINQKLYFVAYFYNFSPGVPDPTTLVRHEHVQTEQWVGRFAVAITKQIVTGERNFAQRSLTRIWFEYLVIRVDFKCFYVDSPMSRPRLALQMLISSSISLPPYRKSNSCLMADIYGRYKNNKHMTFSLIVKLLIFKYIANSWVLNKWRRYFKGKTLLLVWNLKANPANPLLILTVQIMYHEAE